MPFPANYHSYFATTPNISRPIPIHRGPHDPFGAYDLSNRVMTFTPPAPTITPNESHYTLGDLGFENFENNPPQPCTSIAVSSDSMAIPSYSCVVTHPMEFQHELVPTDSKKKGNNSDSASEGSISEIRMVDEHGYKRREMTDETGSETGFSLSGDEDDCRSHCGCVHSCDEINDVEQAQSSNSNTRRFRSIGDILGYAKVVRSQRMETLAELQNALDRFNSTRQAHRSIR